MAELIPTIEVENVLPVVVEVAPTVVAVEAPISDVTVVETGKGPKGDKGDQGDPGVGGFNLANVILVGAADDAAAIINSASNKIIFLSAYTTYNTAIDINQPSTVSVMGWEATINFTGNKSYKWSSPSQNTFCEKLAINGGLVSMAPLIVGDPVLLTGSKTICRDVFVQRTAVGGIAAQVHNLQNSEVHIRCVNNDGAITGILIDTGSKNLDLSHTWSSSVNGPSYRITTTSGTQRTSKIFMDFGLMENTVGSNAATCGTIQVEDAEHVTIRNVALNCADALAGIYLTPGGNRDGAGPKMPSMVTVDGCQIGQADYSIFVNGLCTTLQVGGCEMTAGIAAFKVVNAASRIKIFRPNHAENPVRFEGANGAQEHKVIQRHVGPKTVPINLVPTAWPAMPAAQTEYLGVSHYRQYVDLYEYRYVRLSANVKTAGSAGSKLRLGLRGSSVMVLDFGGATSGTARFTFMGQTTAPIAYNAPARSGVGNVEAKFTDLSNIEIGDIKVTGPGGAVWTSGPYYLHFADGQYDGDDLPLITVFNNSLVGGTGLVVRFDTDDIAGTDLPVDAVGTVRSAWADIPAAAQASDAILLLYGLGGNGATSPEMASIAAEFS